MAQKKRFRKVANWFLKAGIIAFITLCLVELVYRYQWVDFYKTEWEFQNKVRTPDQQKRRALVLGDSFSADTASWVNQWKKDSDLQIFNAAIPGVGPETYRLIVSNRVEEAKPHIVVVQLYEGNDLYDLSRPVNWSAFGWTRNIFWKCSNTFRSLGFINYRLGQSNQDLASPGNAKTTDTFSLQSYDARTKLYILGDVTYPMSMVQLKGEYADQFQAIIEMLQELKSASGKNARFYVLTIPTCVQTNRRYVKQYKQLGAKLSQSLLKGHPWAERIKDAGFEVIDPIEALRLSEKSGTPVYYENDPHLNSFGQQLVAEYVQQILKNDR
ncbi:MAG: hypothetical protein A3D31_17320 [Candidatus Fluviicola riflensis]|nr:MAG: hypothetical protein CHH17_02260 [Candidatus Fluviicola riflensis]OGS76746.1 MAG: hypothetical protein A3D31_17320 [Candidatus Fluviicola riflensis]OGS82899.1 MAG: hypothetical protein A2724_14040 [Fluviicola sp. RIFCSPHIGHO2_01_FULL_43_53]OGS88476.1 MAG: hypothetical protein A3E30_06825 [Fluviicola sp. RIFCSPHIGHO2_12_FULL_43_24]